MAKRKYLNTEKDVIDALQKGETVYEKDFKDEWKVKYYMYNGVIISEWREKGHHFINSGSIYVEKNSLYIKEPIKIEVGKFYRNNYGDKCVCVYESIDKKYKNQFLMIIMGALPEKNKYCVDKEGKADDEANSIADYWSEENAAN